MGSRKRKDPVVTRGTLDDEGEEEDIPIEDDDSSIGSVMTDAEHEADVDEAGSDLENSPASRRKSSKKVHATQNGSASNGKVTGGTEIATDTPEFESSADTTAMMNGLQIKDDAGEDQAIQFGDAAQDISDDIGTERIETIAEKRRREHEEYKKKRDADPAFVPNRGGFFMHDSRSYGQGPNGFRAGRGRGRGGRGGGMPFNMHAAASVADAPWAHDLHETVADTQSSASTPVAQNQTSSQSTNRLPVPPTSSTPLNRTFSRTVQVGNVQLRVFLPNMKEPITFSAVPVHSHTRLPHHRPPLRRDKPVRVSIPDQSPRYIFPAIDRSFIFIPRAMRPNQQGFGRSNRRGGSFGGGYGNFSSRNSIFGGSIYTPSVAMSRRSSIAREIGREGMASPAGSVVSRNRAIMGEGKPVVRLPPAMDPAMYGQYPMQPMQFVPGGQAVYGMPQVDPTQQQRPTMQNYTGPIPMHQPRPQKQVSVADIESPAALNFPPPQVQEQQPFHHQVPASLNGQGHAPESMGSTHSRRTSHPSQQGTPLSQIPERAIHAQSFQPTYPYQQAFYPQQYAQPIYYYPTVQMGSTGAAPPFVPGQQYSYMVPSQPLTQGEAPQQPGLVAHESNGMVYYYDPSQMAASGSGDATLYQQMAYIPSPGYVMTPPGGQVFYPSQ